MADRVIGNDAVTQRDAQVVARFPATANQMQYWREVHLERAGAALNASFRRRLEGRISDYAIQTALEQLIDRHEILRTRFRMQDDGQLLQEVLSEVAFKPDHVDLRHLPSPSREAELERLGAAEARKPFTFSDKDSPAPLFRVLLVRLAPDLACIHFTFHHLVVDGWSVGLIEEEFGKLAAAADSGDSAELPPVDMQFGDYALWQGDVLASPALDGQRDYWKRKLEGLPRFEVSPDRPGPRTDADSQIRSVLLSREVSGAFEALAHAHKHTLTSFATAAAAVALHLMTGEDEVVLGTQIAGRENADAESIVGPVFNSAVLRLPVADGDTYFEFADRARAVLFEAMQNQLLPFAEVARMMGDQGTADHTPLYDINLVVQRTSISSGKIEDQEFGDFRMVSAPSHSAGALWDLSLFMVGREEGWRLSCEGASALYNAETIDALLSVWRKVIEGVVASPQARLANLAVLEPHERRPSKRQRPEVVPVAPGPRRNPRVEALKERIVALQPKGDRLPVIAINNASVLYPVAREIGTDHPFFDIQFCPSPVQIKLPQRHFSDYARDAVEMIRLAQPRGPYVLFGLCIQGAIAIEAARILQSEGEEVPLVVLNDTYRPGYREHMSWLDRQIRAWQIRKRDFDSLHKRWKAGDLPLVHWLDNYRIVRKLGVTKMLVRLGLVAPGEVHDAMHEENRWFVEDVLLPTLRNFELEPYNGRVVLFRSTEWEAGRLFPRDFGWEGYIQGDFEVIDCPGAHDKMFRPAGAQVIGTHIRRILDGAQE
ncbi:condensation domain-containing protein [Novosphingobium malaysiense]|nr:condensation domain-containing protein [Novosphingobium malaysiense]